MTRAQRQRGLTMVEILVSLVLVAIACAFVFSIQVRMSSALRDQSTVSEVQQTLRSASDLIAKDVRMAGFLAQTVGTGIVPIVGKIQTPVEVKNGGAGPDAITIMYADTTTVAVVAPAPANSSISFLDPFGLFETTVTDPTGLRPTPVSGFAVGDNVLATHATTLFDASGNPTFPAGAGCVLGITGIVPPDKIVTNPLAGSIWNLLANLQCTGLVSGLLGTILNMTTVWNDGYTEFVHYVFRTYRIKPLATDPRGVLQMCDWTKSSTFCVAAADWTDLALGIVDMQIALRAYMPSNPTPCAPDADGTHDWFSSDNMNDLLTTLPQGSKIVEVSITLLAKSTKEVQGVVLDKTPDLTEGTASCNHIGDVTGTTLPVASTSSPYYGDRVYRMYTQTVELRNGSATN